MWKARCQPKVASALHIGHSALVEEGATVRVCEGCGDTYDFLKRDVEGDFHFLAMRVEAEANGTLAVIGHWRTGVLVPGQLLHLTRRDGHAVPIESITMQPSLSEASDRKGQRILAVRTPEPESFHAGGCIRPSHA